MIYGVATAAYQIEGAGNEGGRTPCIWDEFAKGDGNVSGYQDGSVACDHYHKYKEDIKLMKELGVDSYRLSIAWPRIFPEKGKYNEEGMQFYINLLEELTANGIKPSITLYHWDLPMWAHNEGGWLNREVVDWYLEYAKVCFDKLDKYAFNFATHNEPFCASFLSYTIGAHAPGHRSLEDGIKSAHHILLSHGKAVELYKNGGYKNEIGIVLNFTWADRYTDSFADRLAQNNDDGVNNRWFLEAVFNGRYPMDIVNLFAQRVSDFSFIQEGDLETISTEIDFLGINYYTRNVSRYDGKSFTLSTGAFSPLEKTDMGWDISPESFRKVIEMVRDYTDKPIYISENGSAWPDVVEDGKVNDTGRISYLEKHLEQVYQMNKDGLNILGYYAWSFMDNYEWAFGYDKRFGIVYVDYETQERIPKNSYYRYQEIIKNKGL